jgi:WD40 repeat protein
MKNHVLRRRYQGNVQNNFMNYSSIGGANESFIVSGSEDARVYIWHKNKEHPVHVLEGHTKAITCVSWNPVVPGLIASASDDCTVRIWGPSHHAKGERIRRLWAIFSLEILVFFVHSQRKRKEYQHRNRLEL